MGATATLVMLLLLLVMVAMAVLESGGGITSSRAGEAPSRSASAGVSYSVEGGGTIMNGKMRGQCRVRG